jgi:AraC-type DNA-binding domain-containing proteins
MELFTRSYIKEWNRIVYFKVLENEEVIQAIHDKTTCKIILFTKGIGGVECNDKLITISAPALICLNEEDTIELKQDHSFEMKALFFRPEALNDVLTYEFLKSKVYDDMGGTTIYQDLSLLSTFYGIEYAKRMIIMLDGSSALTIHNQMEKLKAELTSQKDGYWPCRSRSNFIEILFFLDGLQNNQKLEDNNITIENCSNDFVHNMIQYLNQNISQKISIDLLEKKFACNRNKINKEFHKVMKMTVMKYFVMLRMQLAGNILSDTEIPVVEVALRVGYSDVGYFSRTFKQQFGKSPSDYRAYMMSAYD